MLKELSNQELKELYGQCKEVIDGGKEHYQNERILNTYNKVFNSSDGYLHYSMLEQLNRRLIVEMAERFYQQ